MSRHAVRHFMSVSPLVVESRQTLAEAHQIMREHHVRHLPVVDGGRLVGIVSQRDLYFVETLGGIDSGSDTVAEAMTADPFTTTPDAPLDDVAREMAEHKYGCAVVVDSGKVVGVFTTVDALRALVSVLSHRRATPSTPPGTRSA